MNSKDIKNMIENIIELRNNITGMPMGVSSILNIYQRTSLIDNFSTDSLMRRYMTHEKVESNQFPIKQKYI